MGSLEEAEVKEGSVEELLPEWHTLALRLYTQGGVRKLFDAVVFEDRSEKNAACAVLMHASTQTKDPTQVLIAFTLGVWLGQQQRAAFMSRREDFDA